MPPANDRIALAWVGASDAMGSEMYRWMSHTVVFAVCIASAGSARAEDGSRAASQGLYVRTTLGFGVLTSKVGDGDQDQPSWAVDLLVGSQLGTRTAGGGALLFEGGLSARAAPSIEGVPNRHLNAALFGLFLDGYPFAELGGHLGGAAGLSWASFDANGVGANRIESLGPGGAVWVGEDVPLSSHWLIGPLIRVMAERGRDTNDATNHPWVQSLTLSLTAVYR